jgi:hypothetical protein
MYKQLYNECKKYEGFMFKRCSDYIVILKQPNEDFKCNEMRKDIVNKKYAKFRCNKALVIDIIHSETLTHIYEVDKVVLPDFYDLDIDEVCTHGIHYFLSLEPAYHYDTYYHYMTIGYCTFSQWYSTGQKQVELQYLDGKFHGKYITWYQDGTIKSETNFKNGERIIKKSIN